MRSCSFGLIGQLPTELVKKECIDAGIASTKAAYTAALADIPDSADKSKGIALGQAAAKAVLAKRADDHANEGPFLNKTCPPAGQPGAYQCTPGSSVRRLREVGKGHAVRDEGQH